MRFRLIGRKAKQFTVLGLGGVLACASPLSMAQDEYAISYSMAELSDLQGVQGVYERIVAAAENYCPSYSQIRSQRDVKTCVDGVVADLIDKIDHPNLTSYHTGGESVRMAANPAEKAPRT